MGKGRLGLKTLFESVKEHYCANYKLYLLTALVFLFGVCLGAAHVNMLSPDTCQQTKEPLSLALKQGRGDPLLVFSNAFWGNVKPVLFVWVAGFVNIRLFLCLFAVGYKGVVLGFSIGTFLRFWGMRGFLFSVAAVFPQNIVFLPVLFAMCVLCNRFFYNSPGIRKEDLASYSVLLLLGLIGCVIAALIDAYITGGLLPLLSFLVQ